MSVAPDTKLYKDPNDELVYVFDWSDWLGASAEIDSVTFTISGGDGALTKDNEGIVSGNTSATLRLLGGTLGQTYRITASITTDETPDQTKERSFFLQIVNQ